MPSMTAIYQNWANRYDELVSAEDYSGNLKNFLRNSVDWQDKTVLEAGIGTGRLTRFYIDLIHRCFGFDKEQHMLTRCQSNLQKYAQKITLSVRENLMLTAPDPKPDIFIEGWSFGHTIIQNQDNFDSIAPALIKRIKKCVSCNGTLIIVESEGTNVEEPTQKNESLALFFRMLEDDYGFTRTTLRTDYRFSTVADAVRIMSFFFGHQMADSIRKNMKTEIREFTGVWMLGN